MSKVLREAFPAGEVVKCICGTDYEVQPGDGWKVIDTHPQVQPDGSRKDLPTQIEWNVPCPHCEYEKQFVAVLDDMSGPDWEATRQARADAVKSKAEDVAGVHDVMAGTAGTTSFVPTIEALSRTDGPSAYFDLFEMGTGKQNPATDPTPVVPFAPTGAVPGRDSKAEDTTLPANQAQPSDNPNPAVEVAIADKASTDGTDAAEAKAKLTESADDGKSVEDELQSAASGDTEKTADDVADEKTSDAS